MQRYIRFNKNGVSPVMFAPVDAEVLKVLRQAAEKNTYRHSSFSPAQIYMWKSVFSPAIAFISGCAVFRFTESDGAFTYSYPYQIEDGGNVVYALQTLALHAAKTQTPLRFFALPEGEESTLKEVFPSYARTVNRVESDYLYTAADLAQMQGKKHQGSRNHIKRFTAAHPTAQFVKYTQENFVAVQAFFDAFSQGLPAEKAHETLLARQFFLSDEGGDLRYVLLEKDNVLGVVLGERYGDTVAVHIEKALPAVEGVYPFLVQAFAKEVMPFALYLNREDDVGLPGLRKSKLQYAPCKILPAVRVRILNPLYFLKEIPTLQREGITLTAFTDSDVAPYFALATDDGLNELFGYDYREDCKSPDKEYFVREATRAFQEKTALYFAVKKGEEFLGEATLGEWNGRGECNLSVRLLSLAQGKGVGKTVCAMLTDYALYSLGVTRVTAYCFTQNVSSQKMLASRMRKERADEEFTYFSIEQ